MCTLPFSNWDWAGGGFQGWDCQAGGWGWHRWTLLQAHIDTIHVILEWVKLKGTEMTQEKRDWDWAAADFHGRCDSTTLSCTTEMSQNNVCNCMTSQSHLYMQVRYAMMDARTRFNDIDFFTQVNTAEHVGNFIAESVKFQLNSSAYLRFWVLMSLVRLKFLSLSTAKCYSCILFLFNIVLILIIRSSTGERNQSQKRGHYSNCHLAGLRGNPCKEHR